MSEYCFNESQVNKLTPEKAFEIMFSGYEYLRDLSKNPGSGTYKLLKRIAEGDPETLIKCYLKMKEEQDEAYNVITGDHLDKGLTLRENMINETEQSIYWPGLVVVGRKAEYDVVNLPKYIDMGFGGKDPVNTSKNDWKEDVDGRPDEKAIIAFRRSLVTAGKLLHDFNTQILGVVEIEPKDLAVWDLKQMADRDYFTPYLTEKGLLEFKNSKNAYPIGKEV